ncbi:MAG: aspartate-semialdehyde dehydrogenase [Planctomycetota bacterium]|jgi:aspartate-semialdehyde dehydrogenase|nr:aspartate-semialdehyde dehydrogenase [Planctomycetota bacterium]
MGVPVAIVGATGAVGQEMIKTLIGRDFPADEIRLLASHRSAGKKVEVRGEELEIQELTHDSFEGIKIGLFSAGGSISKEFAPPAIKAGAVVVDNTSAFRMDENTPLVVPEVNPEAIAEHKGVIANPNCSTIQMVQALKPLYDISRIKRIIVSTYQAVSGAGAKAVFEMQEETKALLEGGTFERNIFPYQIAFNALPQIGQKDAFQENGYTDEEMKMVNETQKIFSDPDIRVAATTVRIPVERGHSESVNVEFENRITVDEAREALAAFPGIVVQDDPDNQVYPLASECVGKYETFVGRIREDLSCETALNMWIVSDNLLKGAALNAVQIAEKLV